MPYKAAAAYQTGGRVTRIGSGVRIRDTLRELRDCSSACPSKNGYLRHFECSPRSGTGVAFMTIAAYVTFKRLGCPHGQRLGITLQVEDVVGSRVGYL
jgi:hypothetical protein